MSQQPHSPLHTCPARCAYRRGSTVLGNRNWPLVGSATPIAAAALALMQSPRTFHDVAVLLQIIFDMDGTLTEAHIDFADMRARTGNWALSVLSMYYPDPRTAAVHSTQSLVVRITQCQSAPGTWGVRW